MAKVSDPNEKLIIKNFSDSSVIARRDSAEELSVVEKVLQDIVDYVIRKEEFLALDIPYDSDYIPTTTEESKSDPCTRHSCQKGCVCRSISQKVVKKHCKKEDCIFHCICGRRLVYSLRNLPHRKTLKIMLSNSADDSRKTKRHKRLRIDAPSSQEVPFIDLSLEDAPETIEILDDEREENAEHNINNQSNIPPNRDSLLPTESEGKLARVVIERDLLSFRNMFVWCPTHSRYICTCQGRVFNLRNNVLLHNSKTDMESQKTSPHHFFNLEEHCARTVGSVFNYRLRNFNRIFALKREFEIRKGILSNSNSFFKLNPHPKLASQSKIRSVPEEVCMKRVEVRSETSTSNGIRSHCEPLPVMANKVSSPSPVQPKIQLIFHDNSDSSDEEIEDTSNLPKYGLLCLNGYGYLPIKEYSSTKLVFQHPIIKNIFVSKKDQDEANLWLNDLLKGFMCSEWHQTTHQWVVVQRGVLKISKPFNLKNLKNDA